MAAADDHQIVKRVTLLEISHAELKANHESHAEDIAQLRKSNEMIQKDITELRIGMTAIGTGIANLNTNINQVTAKSLEAVPPSIAEALASSRHNSGIAWALVGVLLTALIMVLGWHYGAHG